MRALLRDGFAEDEAEGSATVYYKAADDSTGAPSRRVAIHFHRRSETMGRELLKRLIEATGWSESDLKRLKLVK